MSESSRRSALAGAVLCLFSACAAAPPPERPSLSVALRQAPGTAPVEVEIWARDALPLTAAELLTPDGTAVAATTLENTLPSRSRGIGRPEVGIGAAGGSSGNVGAGIAIGFPLFLSEPAGQNLIVSRAVIPVRDPADFRARHGAYRVRLVFGAPGRDTRESILPAPDIRPN